MLNVAVLMGGHSAEADVSRSSAREVAAALSQTDCRPTLVEADTGLAAELIALAPDVVFPALHGPPGEDGTVQGLLEMMQLPYVGGDVRSSAFAMDKAVAKLIFQRANLPVLRGVTISDHEDAAAAERRVRAELGDRVVVKPLRQGSALGVTINANGGPLAPALESCRAHPGGALVEEYMLGDEVTVGVLDLYGHQIQPLPVIEIRTADGEWYDFQNRYAPGKSEHIIPPDYPDDVLETLQSIAVSAHQALELRDLSRADFIVDASGRIALLEVNTLPGMTPTSLYPDGAAAIGLSFADLVRALVDSALARHRGSASG